MRPILLTFTCCTLLISPIAFAGEHCGGDSEKGGGMTKWMDTDGDGKVTKSEFLTANEKKFAKMDTNKDGAIDSAEREAAFKKWQERKTEDKKEDVK